MPTPACGPGWTAAEAALKEAGLIYSSSGPDEVHVSDDDHIARELGEPEPLYQAAPYPARAVEAGPDTPEQPGRAGSHSPARPGPGSDRPARARRGRRLTPGPAQPGARPVLEPAP
jgi:hypothetical protein